MTIIRVARREDQREIVRLHRRACESRGRLDVRLAPASGDSITFGRTLDRMIRRGRCRVLVAEEDLGLVGYAIGTQVENRPFIASRYGYVGGVHVERGQQGREMEDALCEGLDDWFKKCRLTVAQTEVSGNDRSAQRFWEDRGFGRFLDHLRWDVDSESSDTGISGLAVRRARTADGDGVIGLWKEMMDSHSAIDPRLSIAPCWRDEVAGSVRRWLREDDCLLIVAESADDVVGFALGGVVDVPLGLQPSRHGQVAHLCVGGGWRRRGIGRQLFWALRDWLVERGVPSIHAYVSPFNPVSQRFWRELGFQDYISRLWCDLV